MKSRVLFLSIILLSFSIVQLLGPSQDVKWKGTIEEEDGIKVIKNPAEPLYGEITFKLEEVLSIGNEKDENYLFYRTWHLAVDKQGNIYVLDEGNKRIQVFDKKGQYLRTIGRKGQGPGEFRSPQNVFVNDKNGEVYVADFRSIKVFASNGNYLKTIPLESFNRSYCISPNGIILGEIDKITFDENNIKETRKIFTSLRLINNMDGSETAIASYPDQISKIIEGRVAKFSHGYEHKFHMCAIGPQIFIYGFSSDYSLNIIDSTGKLLLKIQKESPVLSISKKEKDIVREEYRDSPIKNVNNIPFPKHKPHFGKILADGDWIFVEHYKSPQEQSDVWSFDIFNTQGFYLYKLSFPLRPYLIKNGYVYLIKVLEERGDVLVKRYKIKNWNQLKTGIN
jgi:hypothetical protein